MTKEKWRKNNIIELFWEGWFFLYSSHFGLFNVNIRILCLWELTLNKENVVTLSRKERKKLGMKDTKKEKERKKEQIKKKYWERIIIELFWQRWFFIYKSFWVA